MRGWCLLVLVLIACCDGKPAELKGEPCSPNLVFLELFSRKTVMHLCENEHKTSACKPFVQSFEERDVPRGIPRTRYQVDKPSHIDINTQWNEMTTHKGLMYPGAEIIWRSPVTMYRLYPVVAYLVTLELQRQDGSAPGIVCRAIKLDEGKQPILDKLEFQYRFQYLQPGNMYRVTVHSLPPAKPVDRNNYHKLVAMYVRTGSHFNMSSTHSMDWSPTIAVVDHRNGTIAVKFSLSPVKFAITRFKISLFRKTWDYGLSALNEIEYKGKVWSETEPDGFVFFDQLQSDKYMVKVQPLDQFPEDMQKCQCWTTDLEKYCRNTCVPSVTEWMVIKATKDSRPDKLDGRCSLLNGNGLPLLAVVLLHLINLIG
ncbi:uncharacterized protein LOC131927215 [Physella acuta]|uniref:uncharacterized protein LOC131927215 n=1 Tax=Physella acuta TaxID=109671 RepID=UPI0027DDFCEA|nr:uncharacterized protein LOC131927215 [Physella acuta]